MTDTADLLYGAPAIAAYMRITEKAARHRIEKRQIPTFRMGDTICARRSSIDQAIAAMEAAAMADEGDQP